MPTTKTDKAKTIAKVIVGTSVGFTTSRVISANTPVNPRKRHHKAERWIGSVVIGTMASEAAESWTDRKIDAFVAGWYKFKEDIKSATQ